MVPFHLRRPVGVAEAQKITTCSGRSVGSRASSLSARGQPAETCPSSAQPPAGAFEDVGHRPASPTVLLLVRRSPQGRGRHNGIRKRPPNRPVVPPAKAS